MLERAKQLINDYCLAEYGGEADFSDLSRVGLAYTTMGDDELDVEIVADLENPALLYYVDGNMVKREEYGSLEDMNAYALLWLDFDELYRTAMEAYDPWGEMI